MVREAAKVFYKELNDRERYLLYSDLAPFNLIAIVWFVLVGIYILKAIKVAADSFQFCTLMPFSLDFCSGEELFAFFWVALLHIAVIPIADFLFALEASIEDLRGGTIVFFGGILGSYLTQKLTQKLVLKKYLPTNQELLNYLSLNAQYYGAEKSIRTNKWGYAHDDTSKAIQQLVRQNIACQK